MPEVGGLLKDWLAANRDVLNARFRTARKRFPKLDSGAVLGHCAELLPAFVSELPADSGDPSPLLHEIFDLILLHSGRGLLTPESALQIMLRELFPKLRAQLIARPTRLPASLSNATEHLGARGVEFVRALARLAPRLNSPEVTLDAGTILAWKLGEARLREHALKAFSQIPNATALEALGLGDWPACAAPLAVAALMGDGWRNPRERVRPETLEKLESVPREELVALLEKLAAPEPMPLANWGRCASVCEFAGFGGKFLQPPKLLNAGRKSNAHVFWVRSGDENFRIDADLFGWVCKADSAAQFPVLESPAGMGLFSALGLSSAASKSMLLSDGRLMVRGESAEFSELAGASSFNLWNDGFAATLADSFRVHVYRSVRPAL